MSLTVKETALSRPDRCGRFLFQAIPVSFPFPGLRLIVLFAAALLLAPACTRKAPAPAGRLAAGDGVWFENGVAEGGGDTEATIARSGFAAVYLPIATLVKEGEQWSSRPVAPPAKPFVRIPVLLVISAGDEARASLADPGGVALLGDAIGLAARAGLREEAKYGPIRGVHLDVPFTPSTAAAFAGMLRSLRAKLPAGSMLTFSLRFAQKSDAERETMQKAAAASDGFIAHVLDEGSTADAVSADQLETTWAAAYSAAARGRVTSAATGERVLPESVLARLTDDSRVEFAHDLTVKDESVSGFVLTPHETLTVGGFRLQSGERILFRQPSLSDVVYRLGADLAGKRYVRGRVILLSGRTEADRIFTLAALNDILLGRSLNTDLRVSVDAKGGSVAVTAENPTPQSTLVSRTSNWVEIDLPDGGITDVKPGGFDRFEVFGPDGGAVTLGRATKVRFFETLVGPWERIETARVTVRRPPGKRCCAYRIHVLSSAGAEISREGDGVPTPAPGTTAPPPKR